MDEYVNVVLLSEGWPEASRANAASPVKRFYSTNGSPLFGDFRVSNQTPAVPPSPLNAEDIRRVLKALALVTRLPLLFVWQRGMKINSVLTLTWAVVKESSPLKLQFYGRKRHRKPYRTFIGRD
jgi:integrase